MSTESKKKKQKLPKWFNGELYPAGEVVRNPFSGQEYELTAEELSMYDLIKGLNWMIEFSGGFLNNKTFSLQKDLRKGLDWFRINNPEAYMVLLDQTSTIRVIVGKYTYMAKKGSLARTQNSAISDSRDSTGLSWQKIL